MPAVAEDAMGLKLVSFYRLGSVEAAELLAAWDELPLSEYSQGNREKWKEQNARRSKAKGYDKMKTSLVEVLGVFFQLVPDDQVCSCSEEFGSAVQCEICLALTRLGIDAYSTKELATLQLAGLADKLEAAPPPSGGAG